MPKDGGRFPRLTLTGLRRVPLGRQRLSPADCERRERQRQMKNDEEQPSSEAASEEFFRAVEPEAAQNSPPHP